MRKYLKYIVLAAFFMAFLNACDLTELNKNPNEPDTTNPDYLFTRALISGIGEYNSNVNVNQWTLMDWCMNFAWYLGHEEGKEYYQPAAKDQLWNEMYTNALSNTFEIIKLTENNPGDINKLAIARIWRAFLFHQLTDLWGDIPYSDALKAIDYNVLTPAYDKQEVIYKDLLKELKEASDQFNPEMESFGNSDLIYSGDIAKWKKFANSLRLRLATRIKSVDNELYQQTMQEIEILDFISGNHESALFPHQTDKKSFIAEVIEKGEDANKNYPSKFIIDLLNINNDPRLDVFAEPTEESVFIGMPDYTGVPNLVPAGSSVWNNYAISPDLQNISAIGPWFLRFDTPGSFMSYAEVCFLKSEAALEGYFGGNAQFYFEEGVRADLESYGTTFISQEDIDSHISNLPIANIEEIITQKYIAYSFRNIFEIYAEYRRTGFPKLKDFSGNIIDQNSFPQRFTYPSTEYALNKENVLQAISIQGPDAADTQIWWNLNN